MGPYPTRPVAEESGAARKSSPRCYFCGRDTSDGDYLRMPIGQSIERVCSVCWEKGDEGIDIPLDMTRDEDDDD